jgi:hypothetical protein
MPSDDLRWVYVLGLANTAWVLASACVLDQLDPRRPR